MTAPKKSFVRAVSRGRKPGPQTANPALLAAMGASAESGRRRYGERLQTAVDEIKQFVAGRDVRSLTGADSVRFMVLKANFDGLAFEEKRYAEAEFARLTDPRGGVPANA